MSAAAPGVLRIPAFRRLWIALSLSSLGDWLGLLATTSLAQELVHGYSVKLYALAGVLIVRLMPALFIGPFAGAFVDRFDRRRTMVVADCLRFVLFASIPFVATLWWLLTASFLIECASLFWTPAKEASVPNLVPRERLEEANRLSLVVTYGSAAVASGLFAVLAKVGQLVGAPAGQAPSQVDAALYFDAATFLVSAATVFSLRQLTALAQSRPAAPPLLAAIVDGWRFLASARWLRGLLGGILGAVAAGGAVVGLGRAFAVLDLGGGNAAYGVLFGTLFVGLATGMLTGTRLLKGFSRRRLMGLAIIAAGGSLAADALMPNLALAVACTALVGLFAGVTWVMGITLVGLEVGDDIRGRTFSSLYTLIRVDLLVVLALSPLLAGAIGNHRVRVGGGSVRADGVTIVLLGAGVLAVVVGVLCYRAMDDRPDVALLPDLLAALRGGTVRSQADAGWFVVLEGGEGAGKSTQLTLLAEWLRGQHREVVLTREPGGTPVGAALREVLLHRTANPPGPRAEALLYAADRAQHVTEVIEPALARGAVVLCDRFVDSSLAYQGAGRELPADEVQALARIATGGLRPDLTVVLDIDPQVGLHRAGAAPDRMEAEPLEFHRRIRATFLELARAGAGRYLVLDATLSREQLHQQIRQRVAELIGPSPQEPAQQAPAGRPR